MDDEKKSNGGAVLNGEIQYLSPSQIQTADADGRPDKGCLRRWYYQKVLRRKEPQGRGAAKGEKFHNEIETYSKTGDLVLSDRAMALRPLIQPAGKLWHVEFNVKKDHGYMIRGIPVTMKLDVVNLGRKKWDIDKSEWVYDDGDVLLEILDWKTSKDIEAYALSSDDLAEDNQMVIYGDFGVKTYASGFTEGFVRLSHVYLQTEGKVLPPSYRSAKVSLDQIAEKMETVGKVVDGMKAVAKLPVVKDVPANRKACDAYGGCPHRAVCPKTAVESLSSFLNPKKGKVSEEMNVMDFLDTLPLVEQYKEFEADGKGTPQYHGEAAQAIAESKGIELASKHSGLAGTGERSKEVVRFVGINPPDSVPDGGPLAAEPIPANDIPSMLAEIIAAAKAGGWVIEGLGSNDPVPGKGQFEQFAEKVEPLPTSVMAASEEAPKPRKKRRSKAEIEAEKATLAAKEAQDPDIQAAGLGMTRDESKEAYPEQYEKAKRIQAVVDRAEVVAVASDQDIQAIYQAALDKIEATETQLTPKVTFLKDEPRMTLSGIHLLVDVQVEKLHTDLGKTQRLEPFIENIADELARLDGAADILIGTDGGFLAYGKWKGALKAKVREAVETKTLPAGVYTIRCFGDEVMTVAVKELARYADTVVYGRGGV